MRVKLILWYTKFTLAQASPSLARRSQPMSEQQDTALAHGRVSSNDLIRGGVERMPGVQVDDHS
jgi:hypothetical protein